MTRRRWTPPARPSPLASRIRRPVPALARLRSLIAKLPRRPHPPPRLCRRDHRALLRAIPRYGDRPRQYRGDGAEPSPAAAARADTGRDARPVHNIPLARPALRLRSGSPGCGRSLLRCGGRLPNSVSRPHAAVARRPRALPPQHPRLGDLVSTSWGARPHTHTCAALCRGGSRYA